MEHKVTFKLDENVKEFNGMAGESDSKKFTPPASPQITGRQSSVEDGQKEQKNIISGNPARIRKKHRRGSKRNRARKPRYKWKPYDKLTWEEKRRLEERDKVRAERKREEIIKQRGRPNAPYNTTQFLMEEHDNLDLDHEKELTHERQISVDASFSDQEEVDSNMSSSDENFYDKEFTEAYDMMHAETLQGLSKDALIQNLMEQEHRVEHLHRELRKVNEERMENYINLERNTEKSDSNGLIALSGISPLTCQVCKNYLDHCESCSHYVDILQELKGKIDVLVHENRSLKKKLEQEGQSPKGE